MTEQELKEKIVKIIKQNGVYNGKSMHRDYYVVNDEELADALIAAGIGDVRKFANTLASKIPCHSYYYGDSIVSAIYVLKEGREIKDVKPVNISEFLVDELRRKLKEAEHRAARAERAFFRLVHEMYEQDIRPMCDEKFFIESRLKDAEKELAEERKDD